MRLAVTVITALMTASLSARGRRRQRPRHQRDHDGHDGPRRQFMDGVGVCRLDLRHGRASRLRDGDVDSKKTRG